jgi:DNA-binding response OmpR family regulator
MSRILVVDDLPLNVEYLEEELTALGYDVVTAADGEAALEQVAEQKPDLVLLDLSLPGKDGLAVLATLRSEPDHRGLPVILLTARKELEDRVKGLDAGADDYITKPFHMGEVAARIKAQLRIQSLQREVVERQKRLARLQGIGQTLVTLAHHINNATQAISGMAQLCQDGPEDLEQHHHLVDISLRQSAKISAVLQSLQQMVERMDARTTDYAGDPDRMLDIETELTNRLEELENGPPE